MKINNTKQLASVIATIIVMTLGISCSGTDKGSSGSAVSALATSSGDQGDAEMINDTCATRIVNVPMFAAKAGYVAQCAIFTAHGTLQVGKGVNSVIALSRAETLLCNNNIEIKNLNYRCSYVPDTQN